MIASADISGSTMLHGVLTPYPVGAGGVPKGDWSLTISMMAYKLEGGPVVREKLSARKIIERDQTEDWFAKIKQASTVAITGRMRPYADRPSTSYFDMDTCLGGSDDGAILDLAEEMAKPVVPHDAVLGELTLDRHSEVFTGRAPFNGSDVSTGVDASGDVFAPGAVEATRMFFADAKTWDTRLRAYAAFQLLDIQSTNWSDDKIPASAAKFMAKMTPVSVSIQDNEFFSVDYASGGLFNDHNIMVSGTLDGGPDRASI